MDPKDRLTRPRPGHADLAGAQKYGFDDVRNVLERASARETAARVTIGALCRGLLRGARHRGGLPRRADRLGEGARAPDAARPARSGGDRRVAGPLRRTRRPRREMVAEIDALRKARDTVGGVFEVLAYGAPPGLGSYVHWDRKLDARLAARPDEHPVGEGGGGRRRVRDRRAPGIEGPRRDRAPRGRDRAPHGPRRRDRGRDEHRRADPRARGDEAVLDRAEAARDGGPRHGEPRPSRSSSGPTRAPCRPAAWSGRPSWRSSSRTPCWRSSGATRSPRPAGTSSATWRTLP